MANSQKHTASTLTKSEVRGGGRKPRPQKGQGYARSGSIRSPLWAGGGVIFGPKPYVVHKKINKKEKRLAILSAFYLKEKECTFLENEFLNSFKDYKTKTMIEFLIFNKINIKEDKVLLILNESNHNLWLASRNLKNIKITTVNCLNVKDLLHSNRILVTKSVFNIITANQ